MMQVIILAIHNLKPLIMKKFLLLFILPFICSFTVINTTNLTDAEKKFAVDHLNKTRADLIASVQGLSEAQLNFKTAPDRWSVLECLQHITLASQSLANYLRYTISVNNDSNFKASFSDEQFINVVEDRSHKVQTSENLKPVHSPYKTLNETLKAFNECRDSLITYVNTTNDDLRNHIAVMPFGKVDAYQIILMISAHTNRHTQQLNEVKADPDFPKQ
jgi:hypothetical protein